MVIHDPELLLAVVGMRRRPPVVWDVHEDTPATLSLKPWLPSFLRPPVALPGPHARRVRPSGTCTCCWPRPPTPDGSARPHLVVPNETWVPDEVAAPGVTTGSSTSAGCRRPEACARPSRSAGCSQPYRVAVELIGYADPQSRPMLNEAVAEGVLEWRDFMPNDEALKRLDGALAGLSLLHDEPNYRHSMPTKIMEYMAHGIPGDHHPVTRARSSSSSATTAAMVVPWQDPKAVAQAVLWLRDDVRERHARGARGYAAARANHHWPNSARRFVAQLEAWAGVKS